MNDPDLLLPSGVQNAPLPEVRKARLAPNKPHGNILLARATACAPQNQAHRQKARQTPVAHTKGPQIDEFENPFGSAQASAMQYPAVGVGPVGKWWWPHRQKAGTSYHRDARREKLATSKLKCNTVIDSSNRPLQEMLEYFKCIKRNELME